MQSVVKKFFSHMKSFLTRHWSFVTLFLLSTINLQPSTAATITGHLSDISIQDLNTKIMFAPTNEVLLVGSGLNAVLQLSAT